MATEKQIAANRRNAQLSAGPQTPEGKAISRLNGFKHRIAGKNAVVRREVESAFLDHLHPDNPLETALARRQGIRFHPPGTPGTTS